MIGQNIFNYTASNSSFLIQHGHRETDDILKGSFVRSGLPGNLKADNVIEEETREGPRLLLAGDLPVGLAPFDHFVESILHFLVILTNDVAGGLVVGGGFDGRVDQEAALVLLIADHLFDGQVHQLADGDFCRNRRLEDLVSDIQLHLAIGTQGFEIKLMFVAKGIVEAGTADPQALYKVLQGGTIVALSPE